MRPTYAANRANMHDIKYAIATMIGSLKP